MNDFIIELICDSTGIVLAGIIIWLFQFHYSERSLHAKVYISRIEKEEDDFHEKAKNARTGMYYFFRSITNEHPACGEKEITVKEAYAILNELQKLLDDSICNRVVLSKYKTQMDSIVKYWDVFSNTWNEARRKNNLTGEEINSYNQIMCNAKECIFNAFDNIDNIYYNIKNKKRR